MKAEKSSPLCPSPCEPPMPAADDEQSAPFERQRGIARVADAHEAHAGAVVVIRAHAEIEIPAGEHFEKVPGPLDLQIARLADFALESERIARAACAAVRQRRSGDRKRRCRVPAETMLRSFSPASEVLHVERDVRDVVPGHHARGLCRQNNVSPEISPS